MTAVVKAKALNSLVAREKHINLVSREVIAHIAGSLMDDPILPGYITSDWKRMRCA